MVDDVISLQDFAMLKFPADEEMQRADILSTFYGQYFKWDSPIHTKLIRKEG